MKKLLMIVLPIVVIIAICAIVFITNDKSEKIPDNYIAVFHNEDSTRETYIYKIDNNQANYGFEYINVTKKGNKIKITKKGKFDWTDGAFSIAHSNDAYSYVTTSNSDKKYTIEEYQSMFLMN